MLGLVSVLFLLTAVSLSSGLTAWRRSEARSDIQHNVLLALKRVEREMSVAPASSILIHPNSWTREGESLPADAVAFPSPRDGEGEMTTTPAGDPRFSRVVIYWIHREAAELWETVLPLTPPVATPPHPLLPPPVAASLAGSQCRPPPDCGTARRVARCLRRFSCRESGKTFHLVLETERPPYRSMLETSILPLGRSLGNLDD